MNCLICGKEITNKIYRINICSSDCMKKYNQNIRLKKSIKNWRDKLHCECKICGFMGKNLFSHIKLQHNITAKEYYKKFNCDISSLVLEEYRINNSLKQKEINLKTLRGFKKGEDNPAKKLENKTGINSPYSMNFKGYKDLTDEEKQKKINDLKVNMVQKKKENESNPLTLKYWLNKGYTQETAEKKVKRTSTNFYT